MLEGWAVKLIAFVVIISVTAGGSFLYGYDKGYKNGYTEGYSEGRAKGIDLGIAKERQAWEDQKTLILKRWDDERKVIEEKYQNILLKVNAEKVKVLKQNDELEAAIEAQRIDDEQNTNPSCPPALSKRLRDVLAPIGR